MQKSSSYRHLPFSVNILRDAEQCKILDPGFTCDFALYSNATNLTDDQKLAPDPSITGYFIFIAFVATTFSALILSFILCIEKVVYKVRKGNPIFKDSLHYHHGIHAIESLLLTLSDQQLASGTTLLVTLDGQSCSISAYHYNVVCAMLLLSAIVHFVSLVSVPDYLYRVRAVGGIRISAILCQLGFTIKVFLGRNTKIFPFDPSPLSIMHAACFENATITDAASLAYLMGIFSNITTNATLTVTNTTGNGTETIWHNINAASNSVHGLWGYIFIFVCVAVALFTLCFEWQMSRKWHKTPPNDGFYGSWYSIAISILATLIGFIVAGDSYNHYKILSSGMEVEKWYQVEAEVPISVSDILPLSLLGSSIIPLVQAFCGLLPPRVRRYFFHLQKQIKDDVKVVENMDKATDEL